MWSPLGTSYTCFPGTTRFILTQSQVRESNYNLLDAVVHHQFLVVVPPAMKAIPLEIQKSECGLSRLSADYQPSRYCCFRGSLMWATQA
mmetsp:Transcript_10065/g.21771  ORF Transcript_10065/g.21771 Transcript_10065/m.21771 type:complete len:89 (-) Transcript_10065:120-386(-)